MVNGIEDIDEELHGNPVRARKIHFYEHGSEVIREGEYVLCFYVILSGQVRITQHGRKIRLLGDYDVFGLDNMIFRERSLYTARTVAPSRIASYGPEALDHFIREIPRMTQNILVSVLRQLAQTTENMAEEITSFSIEDSRVRFFRNGEAIIEEGTIGTDFYRLVTSEGGLRVSIKGKEISCIKSPGEFFGEMAGLLNLPRQATITSIGESVVESYSFDDLEIIIRDYPDTALQMMRTFVERLNKANLQLTDRTHISAGL